ncbi:MAG: phage holin family protein [Baekduia sp.]
MSEDTRQLGIAVESLVQRGHLLLREEIELAKTEVAEKAMKLGQGSAVGIVAGFFALWALLMFLLGLASLITWAIGGAPFWGYFIVTLLLLVLAGIGALVAAKFVKAGGPPAPTKAIDEAKLIRQTVQSDDPVATVTQAKGSK